MVFWRAVVGLTASLGISESHMERNSVKLKVKINESMDHFS